MEVVHIFLLFLVHKISSCLPFYTTYCIFHIAMCLLQAMYLVISSLPFLWQLNWPRPPWNQRLSHFYSFSSFQFLLTCVSWHLYRVALFTACTPINVSPCNFTFKSDFSTLLDILKSEPSWTANFRGLFVKRVWQRRPISAKDDKFSWSVDDEKAGVQFPQVSGS